MDPYKVVAIKHMAKETAQFLEACCEPLTGDQLGFVKSHFVKI